MIETERYMTIERVGEAREKARQFRRQYLKFVVMALEFFAGYVTAENAEEYLIKTIASMMDAKLGISGDRMEGMLFKVVVEVAMQNRILANAIRVDESRVEEIREKAVDDVRRIWR